MKKENWVWMPHAAHFILGDECKFVLATYVGKYIVSTVGELLFDNECAKVVAPGRGIKLKEAMGDPLKYEWFKKNGYEDLHCGGWKYETMVFKAKKNTDKDCQCCPWLIESGSSIDNDVYKTVINATKGHMRLCKKWSKK